MDIVLVCTILNLNYCAFKYIWNESDYVTVPRLIHQLPDVGVLCL
jgi:hypothetical protein